MGVYLGRGYNHRFDCSIHSYMFTFEGGYVHSGPVHSLHMYYHTYPARVFLKAGMYTQALYTVYTCFIIHTYYTCIFGGGYVHSGIVHSLHVYDHTYPACVFLTAGMYNQVLLLYTAYTCIIVHTLHVK